MRMRLSRSCYTSHYHSLLFFAEYVRRYASADAMNENEDNMSTSSESSLSDFSENEAQDMEL